MNKTNIMNTILSVLVIGGVINLVAGKTTVGLILFGLVFVGAYTQNYWTTEGVEYP
jgi:hypothetical protein